MNSSDLSQQNLDSSITIKIKNLSRNKLIAKIILASSFAVILGLFYNKNSQEKYEVGLQLTPAKHQKNYEKYKISLMSEYAPRNPATSIFIMLIIMSFLIGSYELAALAISLIIGKVFKS